MCGREKKEVRRRSVENRDGFEIEINKCIFIHYFGFDMYPKKVLLAQVIGTHIKDMDVLILCTWLQKQHLIITTTKKAPHTALFLASHMCTEMENTKKNTRGVCTETVSTSHRLHNAGQTFCVEHNRPARAHIAARLKTNYVL